MRNIFSYLCILCGYRVITQRVTGRTRKKLLRQYR